MSGTKDLEVLEGEVDRIVYSDPASGYTVARVRSGGELKTLVGNLVKIVPGERIKAEGNWERNPRFGMQFKVSSFSPVLPATVTGIERYLSSGVVKGIGPVMARRLVAKFGLKTLEIIENNPELLRDVEGVGEARAQWIRKAWSEQREARNVMVFLRGYDIGPSLAFKIYKHYGKEAIDVVKKDPFRLSTEIQGIGFKTADKIAGSVGIPARSPARIEAAVEYTLSGLSDEGHLCSPVDDLITDVEETVQVERELILSALEKLSNAGRIKLEDIGGEGKIFAYLSPLWWAESGSAKRLAALIEAGKEERKGRKIDGASLSGDVPPGQIEMLEGEMGVKFAWQQKVAIDKALDEKVLVITGGPGTGKTTIIRAILSLMRSRGRKVVLAAPTGRAARRLQEATGYFARTIHRLLEAGPATQGFKRNDNNPIDADVVILDEASMIDNVLFNSLLKAVPPIARLIIVGDADQLPSVGPGNVLKELISSGNVPVVYLNEIFRQSKESLIVVNAHRILKGDFPILPKAGEEVRDFYFITEEDPVKVVHVIRSLCADRIPRKFGFDPFDGIQVITPMHKGPAGVTNLNLVLQEALNSSQKAPGKAGGRFRPGDKVMQIKNNYSKDVYNGDIGRIESIEEDTGTITVGFDTGSVRYESFEQDELTLAYCVSVHKSQGAEYEAVVMPVLTQHFVLLQRNLLYTGVTRGKKLVVLVGTKKALAIALRNDKVERRWTALGWRLSKILN